MRVNEENFVVGDKEDIEPSYVDVVVDNHNKDEEAHPDIRKQITDAKLFCQEVKDSVQGAADTARNAATRASDAAGAATTAAEVAAVAAETASDCSEEAAQAAKRSEEVVQLYYPQIVDGEWFVFNYDDYCLAPSGIMATGERGPVGPQGEFTARTPICKAYIPIAENGRELQLTSIEGLEVGGLLTKLIVSENAEPYWQSRVIESIEEYEAGTKIEPTDNLKRTRATWEGWAKGTGELGFGGVANKDELQTGQKIYLEGTISDEDNAPCWLLGIVSDVTSYVKLEAGTRVFLEKDPFGKYITLSAAGFSKSIAAPLNENSKLQEGLLIYQDGTTGIITLTKEQLGEDLSIINGIDSGAFNEVGFGAFVNGHHNKSTGIMSHTTGEFNTNTGYRASCENSDNNVSGKNSSARGYANTVSGDVSSAEGNSNEVTADNAHAEGMRNKVTGKYGHGEGYGNIVASDYQHVQGRWNKADTQGQYVDIVGWGNSDTDRKNIYTLDKGGNAEFAGNINFTYNGEAIDLGKAFTNIETALLEIEAMADSLIGGDAE